MGAYYSGKPKSDIVPQPKRASDNHACRKITYRNRSPIECGKPTKGATYCKGCQMDLITLTDRKPPTQTQRAANHPWTEEGIQRAQRAKRTA